MSELALNQLREMLASYQGGLPQELSVNVCDKCVNPTLSKKDCGMCGKPPSIYRLLENG